MLALLAVVPLGLGGFLRDVAPASSASQCTDPDYPVDCTWKPDPACCTKECADDCGCWGPCDDDCGLTCYTCTCVRAPAPSPTPGPCDILAAAGTPCVAAHSTVRALYDAYTGPLYDVLRASDGKTTSILASNGFADAAAQDAFCGDNSAETWGTDPLSCFTEEPEAAQLPNKCSLDFDVKTDSNTAGECASKCLADPKCLSFVKGTANYYDPHACLLSYTCAAPTSFLAGFDGFFRNTTGTCAPPSGGCTISRIYDQSGHQNHLLPAPGGSAHGAADNAANATALGLAIGGHKAYGALFEHGTGPGRAHSGTGYRCDNTTAVPTGDAPQTIYMVTSGRRYNAGCCFDVSAGSAFIPFGIVLPAARFLTLPRPPPNTLSPTPDTRAFAYDSRATTHLQYGNAETNNRAGERGAMEALYFGNISAPGWSRGMGSGPWVMADMENGVWAGNQTPVSATNTPVAFDYVTAVLKGGPGRFGLRAANANEGKLKTMYEGGRPAGYEVCEVQCPSKELNRQT